MATGTGKCNKPLIVLALFLWTGLVVAAPPQVETTRDLQADARLAREQGVPLLLMFSAPYCEYCQRMEEDFLQPMLISGDYDGRVLIRKLSLSPGARIEDFDGRRIDAEEIASRYRVWVTPTVVFLDGDGKELTERLVGLSTPDFFGGYLYQAIESAGAALAGLETEHHTDKLAAR